MRVAAAALVFTLSTWSPSVAADQMVYRVPALTGGHISNEDFKGKIVILDVWATWCGPCQMVIPHLVELQKEYGDRGVVVVGINANDPGEKEKAKVIKFVDRFGINYPVGMMTGEAYIELLRVMGVEPTDGMTIPTTIIIDRDSRIVHRYPGYFRGQEREISSIISRMLLKERGSGGDRREGKG